MKGDHMGILAADPTQRELPLSNWARFRYQRTAHRTTSAVNCRPLNSLPCVMPPAPPSALSRRAVYPIRTRLTNLQQSRASSLAGRLLASLNHFVGDLVNLLR